MPQVDFETLVSACKGEGKVACETTVEDARELDSASQGEGDEIPIPLPDYAPESFWLSKDAEYDWFDRNAFFQRKESINSHSASHNPNVLPPLHPGSNSSSQRFLINRKSKASIIGLPKTQKTAFAEAKNRKNGKPSGNTRMFPNRAGSTASKPEPTVIEPGSPKVSCMGRVRSKRDRNGRVRNQNRQTEPAPPSMAPSKPSERSGLFSSLRAMFRSRRRTRSGRKDAAPPKEESVRIVRDIRERLPAKEAEALRSDSVGGGVRRRSVGERDDGDAPSLGGMKKFVSGRRSDSWGLTWREEIGRYGRDYSSGEVFQLAELSPDGTVVGDVAGLK